ncbi:cation:proton antiporter [Candidatus Woesearchaeota archaeon]|nr:cation:proton antiporter [Candidatus Woesearchaeota archaeon]
MATSIFIELTLLFILTIVISGLARLLKQPLIVGYIITGILAGPYFLNLIKSTDAIATFAEIGIVFLLFIVGLNLNPKLVKDLGKVSLITGIGQVLFTVILGFFISKLLGFSTITSIYLATALAFSSTIIIMKLLSDRNDLESLYGRITTGFLIVQDLLAILVLLFVSSLNGNGEGIAEIISLAVIKGIAAITILYLIGNYLLPRITKIIAKSQEFLLIFSVSWCFAIAGAFQYFNFSIEAGALLAGIALSLTPYQHEISSKMRPLRDFFLIMFFILHGSQLLFGNISQVVVPAAALSLLVLLGNPLIVMILMGILGYTKRNGFMAGLTSAQISEFSIILIALAVELNHVAQEFLSLIILVGLITMTGSTYLIVYADRIYPALAKYLKIFEKKGKKVDEHKYHTEKYFEVILFGYNRIGFSILDSLEKLRKKILIIDYDPEVILQLAKDGHECKYGDADDVEMLNELDLSQTKMIISTIPHLETNILILNRVKRARKKITVILVSHQLDESMKLYDAGATYVIMPHFLGGKHISTMIEDYKFNMDKFIKEKVQHLAHIKRRKELGHEHPKVNE